MASTRSDRRRVVAFSVQDRQRIERGELPEAEAEFQRRRDLDAFSEAQEREGDGQADRSASNDARLLADVPPHWGNGR